MMKKIFSIPGLIFLVLVLAAAYLALWMGLRSTVTSGVANYITELESEGYQIEHGGLSITGFPFAIHASSPNISVRSANDVNGNWSIVANKLEMHSATVSPLSWSVNHAGNLEVDLRTFDGTRFKFDVTPASINADVTYGISGSLKALHAKMGRTQINPLQGEKPAVLGLSELVADIGVSEGTNSFDMRVNNIQLSEEVLGVAYEVLGPQITDLSLRGHIENWTILETEGLEPWLQSSSKIKSDKLNIRWSDIDIVSSFEFGFKNNLPEGDIRFRIEKTDVFVKTLVTLNIIDPIFSNQLTAVLNGMDADPDGRKTIEFNIRDGAVKYGFFTLFQL